MAPPVPSCVRKVKTGSAAWAMRVGAAPGIRAASTRNATNSGAKRPTVRNRLRIGHGARPSLWKVAVGSGLLRYRMAVPDRCAELSYHSKQTLLHCRQIVLRAQLLEPSASFV